MKPPSRLIAWSSPDDDGESQLVSACVYFFALKLYWARLEKSLCKGTEETVKEVQVHSITTTHNAREQQRSLASPGYPNNTVYLAGGICYSRHKANSEDKSKTYILLRT